MRYDKETDAAYIQMSSKKADGMVEDEIVAIEITKRPTMTRVIPNTPFLERSSPIKGTAQIKAFSILLLLEENTSRMQ